MRAGCAFLCTRGTTPRPPGKPRRARRGTFVALTDLRRPAASPAPRPVQIQRTGARPPVPARPHAWPRMLLLAVTMMLSLAGLNVALTETSWWIVGSLFILLALVTATLVRQLTRPVWLPTVAGALVTLP